MNKIEVLITRDRCGTITIWRNFRDEDIFTYSNGDFDHSLSANLVEEPSLMEMLTNADLDSPCLCEVDSLENFEFFSGIIPEIGGRKKYQVEFGLFR